MPNYHYECDTCGTIEERFFLMADRKRWVKCQECGKRATRALGVRPMKAAAGFQEFWSISSGMTPMDFRNHCRRLGKDPATTKTVEVEGFAVRPDGCVHIKNRAQWNGLKKSRGMTERGSYVE